METQGSPPPGDGTTQPNPGRPKRPNTPPREEDQPNPGRPQRPNTPPEEPAAALASQPTSPQPQRDNPSEQPTPGQENDPPDDAATPSSPNDPAVTASGPQEPMDNPQASPGHPHNLGQRGGSPPPLPPKRPRPSAPLLPISPPSWATPSRSRRSSPPAYPAPTWSATPGPTLLLTRQMSQLATSLDLIHGNRPASELTADEHLRAQTLSLRLAQLMDQLTMHLESQRKERQRARLPQRRPLLPAFFHAIASRRDRSATTPTRSSNPEPELPKT